MAVNGLDLHGKVTIVTAGAVTSVNRLAEAFEKLDVASKVGLGVSEKTARAFAAAATAASQERTAVASLAKAQSGLNKETAQANVLAERANAIKRGSIAGTRLTKARTGAVVTDAASRTAIAEGKVALVTQRALTEEVRRTTLAEDAQGRAAIRAAQLQSIASRDQIAAQRLALAQQRAATASTHIGAERAATALGHVGSTLTHIGTIGAGVFIGITANAVIMEKQFAAVVRTSELAEKSFDSVGDKAEAIKGLRTQFDALAQELPISYKELTEIGSAANQLGIQTKDLATFTKSVAQFSATTGVSVDTASTAFGRLNSLVTDVVSSGKLVGEGVNGNFEALADSINRVGVKSVATDQQIINIASQIAGIANAAGLGYKQIVGFSGALASVAVSPYLARGATTRLFTNIGNAVAEGGAKLDAFAKVAGESAQDFKDAWNNDPQKALVDVFAGINDSGKDAVNVMKDLGINSVLDQPALLRVAKLADSAGNAGKGLAQSFYEASHAAQENQKQYAIIADTVQGRLQIALNRAQILLRNIGDSNLGPLGDAISGISSGLLHLSQNLDKPVKLFGQFKLPFTNAQLLGFAVAAAGIGGAFTLGVGALAKFGAALLRVRTAGQFVQGILTRDAAATEAVGAASAVAAREVNALAAAQERQAVAGKLATGAVVARPAAKAAGAAAPAVTPGVGAFNPNILSKYSATVAKLQTSSNGLVRTLGTIGLGGTTAFSRVAAGASKVSGAITRLGGAARTAGGAVSGLVGGPLSLAVLAGTGLVLGTAALDAAMRSLGTSAGDAGLGIIKATTAVQQLQSVSIATQDPVGALFDKSTRSVGSLIGNTDKLGRSLENLGSGGALSDFGSKFVSIFEDQKITTGFNTTTQGLDKLDAGFQQLSDSGNITGAIKGIQTLFKGQSDTAVTNSLAHMANATGILRLALDQAGVGAGKNDKNLLKLVHSNSILGKAAREAAEQVDYQTKAFNGDAEAAGAFTAAQGKLVDAATDLGAAYDQASQKAGGSGASFKDFIKQAKSNFTDFANAQTNAAKIATDTGASFEELSSLPAKVLAAAAKDPIKGQQLVDAMGLNDAGRTLETSLAAITNNPKIAAIYHKLGPDLRTKLNKSLREGTQIDDAFKDLGPDIAAAYKAAVNGTQLGEFNAPELKSAKAVIQISGNPIGAIKAGESAKKYIDRLKANLTTIANTLPATQAGETAAEYIKRIPTIMTVLGNNAPAIQKGESAKSYIDRLKGVLTADANNLPAIKKGESARAYINRLSAVINVNANLDRFNSAVATAVQTRTMTIVANYVSTGKIPPKSGGVQLGPATGGIIRGPGTGVSDSIPAMLSNGEFVVRAAAVKKNMALLTEINGGAFVHRARTGYATGGPVNSSSYEGTYASRQSVKQSRGPAINVTELSAYDRHLLEGIRDAVGFTLDTGTVSQAANTGNTRQSRRGNG